MVRYGNSNAEKRPCVVIPDDVSNAYAQSAHLSRLRDVAEIVLYSDRPTQSDLSDRLRLADAVISFRPAFTQFPKDVLAASETLRLVSISGTGVNDVDVEEATRRGIAVANVPGPANRSVAELCVAMMFDIARSVSFQDRQVRAGRWHAASGVELKGRTLGLLGFGGIARELSLIAKGIGMEVLTWSRSNDPERAAKFGARATSLEEVLAASDVISLHLSLSNETKGFAGERLFAAMKPGAIFINTARGALVDENALVSALRSGKLRGAGLDVFSVEPLPGDHPFRSFENVLMTPVSAWNTSDAADRMLAISIDNVLRFFAGQPQNISNEDYIQNTGRMNS